MKKNKLIRTCAILVVLTLTPIVTLACSKSDESRRPQGPPGPPPEAIKACEGKKAGDTTTFTGRRGETLTATCKDIEGQLAAVPEGGPR